MFMYAAGKHDLRNRIDPAWVAAPTAAPVATTKVARLEYAARRHRRRQLGPRARRLARGYANWFQRQTSFKLDVANVEAQRAQARRAAPLAVLTGTAKQAWTPDQAAALRGVRRGRWRGAGRHDRRRGRAAPFDASVADLLRAAFPSARLELGPAHPPHVTGGIPGTEDLASAAPPLGNPAPRPRGAPLQVLTAGKGHVIVSPLDITSGLLGTDTGGIVGYEPATPSRS